MFKVSIASHLEEGACTCGWPMYVGDYGYWSNVTNTLYCCKAHATEAETESAEAEAGYYTPTPHDREECSNCGERASAHNGNECPETA